jgi:hypothetical protein
MYVILMVRSVDSGKERWKALALGERIKLLEGFPERGHVAIPAENMNISV